jgi:hypothetical protein
VFRDGLKQRGLPRPVLTDKKADSARERDGG